MKRHTKLHQAAHNYSLVKFPLNIQILHIQINVLTCKQVVHSRLMNFGCVADCLASARLLGNVLHQQTLSWTCLMLSREFSCCFAFSLRAVRVITLN